VRAAWPNRPGRREPTVPQSWLVALHQAGCGADSAQHQHPTAGSQGPWPPSEKRFAPSPSCQKLKLCAHWSRPSRPGLKNRCRPARRYAALFDNGNAIHNSEQAQNDSGCQRTPSRGEGRTAGGGQQNHQDKFARQAERHGVSRPCSCIHHQNFVIKRMLSALGEGRTTQHQSSSGGDPAVSEARASVGRKRLINTCARSKAPIRPRLARSVERQARPLRAGPAPAGKPGQQMQLKGS